MIQDSEWYKTQLKIQKIQMRAHCMKARNAPKSLLKATSRDNIKDEMTLMAGSSSSINFADQLIKQGILDDKHYDEMRQTLKSRQGQTLRNTGSLSMSPNKVIPFQQIKPATPSGSQFQQSPTRTFQRTEPHSDPPPSAQPASEIDYDSHPMVRELTSRGLTTAAGKRKLQATVKVEIEAQLKDANTDLDLKDVSPF